MEKTTGSSQGSGAAERASRFAFLRGTFLVAAAMGVAQFGGYLLSVIGPRVLSPGDFGALASVMNLWVIAAVLPFAVQAVAARLVVSAGHSEREVGTRLVRFSLAAGLVMAGVALALTPLLSLWLRQPSVWNIALVALLLPGLTVSTCQYGLTQGHEDNPRLASLLVLHAVVRYGMAIALLVTTHSVTATVFGMFLGTTLGALLGWPLVARFVGPRAAAIPDLRSQVLHATHALFALFLATNIDLLLARYFLTADESGAYAVGAIVSKIAFWLPSFIAVVTFARMVDGRRNATTLKAAMAVSGIGILLILGLVAVPQLVLAAVAGPNYMFMSPYLWLFGVIGSAFSVAQFVLYSRLAVDDRKAALALWGAVVLIAVGVTIWHASVATVAVVVAGVATLVAVLGVSLLVNDKRRGVAATPEPPLEALEAP